MARISIDELHLVHPGISPGVAAALAEAARVCLDRHHEPPVDVDIEDDQGVEMVSMTWTPTDERTKGAWANELDATRDGAYACTSAGLKQRTGLLTVQRAESESGADYFVAPAETADDRTTWIRLEVSGVNHGNRAVIARRLREKLGQLRKASASQRGIAGVVGFRERVIRLSALDIK